MDSTSAKRFVKALRYAEETLVGDAKCYCYTHEPEYQEVHEALKFAIRMLEQGEQFAGKLLYKNARQITPGHALELTRQAKSDEERNFFAYIGDMNLQRAQWHYIRNVEPTLYQKKDGEGNGTQGE